MSGNVYEWVQDKFTKYQNVGTDNPIYERSGGNGVVRCGGWVNSSRYLRCSNRRNGDPSGRYDFLGFRLVRIQ
ncbi:MAG: SUMF1/EgtB/PvdO family nonheme iron enzyme [SAR324 cluster bacterium]|nr:SUMF1/EgtB/PvdO family nonheme iron enzyme [SAR324 cluster bacterium]